MLARFLSGELDVNHFEERIREQESRLHVWVDQRLESPAVEGPLRGAPYGAKDILETHGYLTTYGSPLYAGRVGETDAALIEMLRARGAVLMGKTQTTAFAYFDPAPTRNPREPAHSPGGSSSGSAAAVAAGMVPFSIGTQTQGSIVRPASYCGVVGIKPSFGLLPTEGILPFAPTLDTAGFFTETALDLRLLWEALGHAINEESPSVYGMLEFTVDPEMQTAFRETIQALSHYGCKIKRFSSPPAFGLLPEAIRTINSYEGARTHEQRFRDNGASIGIRLAKLVEEGLAIAEPLYENALGLLYEARRQMADVFAELPVIFSAAAPGPAPRGLASTGDPRCNAPWTALGGPALTIPMPVKDSLPLGLQMAAAPGQDAMLIATACHCQALLNAGLSG
jgi:Asp-tRNA(Asn)/Glu-tRNA(Gln) amidotransferase A subunit family amidase